MRSFGIEEEKDFMIRMGGQGDSARSPASLQARPLQFGQRLRGYLAALSSPITEQAIQSADAGPVTSSQ
jgi:hypothetical protein